MLGAVLKKFVIKALVIITIVLGVSGYILTHYTLSRGVRAGKLVKVSQTGIFMKTYEGTIDLGSGNDLTWQFSIHDKELGEQLSQEIGKSLRLEYRVIPLKLFYTTRYDVVSWGFDGVAQDLNFLCRLVEFMRENASIVSHLRPIIQERDAELFRNIKLCQSKKN